MNSTLTQGLGCVDKDTGAVYTFKKKRGRTTLDLSRQDARSESRSTRYRLQNQSGSILRKERVCRCCKVNIDNKVDVFRTDHQDGSKSSHYAGLMFCGSVWHCPVCGAKVAERRSQELREAFDAANEQGYHVAHVTFTFPHQRTDNLADNLAKFLDAFKRFWDSAPMRRFKEKYGLMGRIRALETTWSKNNGFHPHIHLLTFTSVRFDDLKGIRSELLKVWNDKLARVGLGQANKHGISVQNGQHAGEYINKFADDSKLTKNGDEVTWDMADEMTKLNSKGGRGGSLTPFDFLRVIDNPEAYGYKTDDIPMFRALFKEYGEAFKGRSQLEWGRGSMNVRKNLGLGEAKTDEELVNEVVEEAQKVISLPREVFTRLVPKRDNNQRDLRAIFLTICETKPLTDIQNFLHTSCFPELNKNDFMSLLRLGNSQKSLLNPEVDDTEFEYKEREIDCEQIALTRWLERRSA